MARRHGGIRTASVALVAGFALLGAACGDTADEEAVAPQELPSEEPVETSTPTPPFAAPVVTEPTPGPASAKPASAKPASAKPASAKPASATPASATPAPAAPDHEDDGTWHALLVRAERGSVGLDKVEFLSGAEAAAARAEDGEPVEAGVDMPYVRNRNTRVRTLPVASDVTVDVIDCSPACKPVSWSYDALVAGEPLPYGPADALFTVTVENGTVIRLAEVYLP